MLAKIMMYVEEPWIVWAWGVSTYLGVWLVALVLSLVFVYLAGGNPLRGVYTTWGFAFLIQVVAIIVFIAFNISKLTQAGFTTKEVLFFNTGFFVFLIVSIVLMMLSFIKRRNVVG